MGKKALNILMNTFWGSGGWKNNRRVADADFEYAKNQGFMFEPKICNHDEIIHWLVASFKKVNPDDIVKGFVASLTSRRLEYWSALGSLSFARNFPNHSILSSPIKPCPSGAVMCEVCGLFEFDEAKAIDLNVLNFERYKWGGVRHDSPDYAALDLELFSKLAEPKPVSEDWEILEHILNSCSSQPREAKPNHLESALKGLFPSNKDERRTVIEILSLAGVLKPQARQGYFKEFVMPSERQGPTESKNDWGYPARWWRGSDSVNLSVVDHYFPRLKGKVKSRTP